MEPAEILWPTRPVTPLLNRPVWSAKIIVCLPADWPAKITTFRSDTATPNRNKTRRPASADRTGRRQFQATGQPVSRTQASDAMTSRPPRYEAKCVQRRYFQRGSVPLRSDIKGTELPPANILIPLERQLNALQLCRWHFLYNETLQQTSRPLLSKLYERRQIWVFDPHFEEVKSGVEPWLMARWKARVRLPIRHNWTFFR